MRLMILLALGACRRDPDPGSEDPADIDPDTGSDSAPDPGPACENEVVEVSPAQGAVDVPLAAEVVFRLAETDLTALVTVTDSNGAVQGGVSITGPVVTWTPDALLTDTVYNARISHACGSEEVSWTTRAGVPVEGRVYEVVLADGQWVEPEEVGASLAATLGEATWILSPTSVDGPGIDFLTGTGDADEQDLCAPTVVCPGGSWTDPSFQLDVPRIRFTETTTPVVLQDGRLSGRFAADGARLDQAVLVAQMDTRPLVPLIEEDGPPDLYCEVLATLGVSCVACLDGSGAFCVDIRVEDLAGMEIARPLVERTEDDVRADPSCER